ncbi:MAG: hypothetical protein J0I17_10365 ['Candidatus Kapabacteria' thiocyanatum]|uniref:Uncharacterized protein n=1 Tax=Candidatus Kapaibacterium thiocyanatum TaxID=1895771 RepID=A0A1M3L3G7_9BACT|nr:hypothetical protein ['Candidatus Kapabacteria' thiocyanatum]OJX59897.1 MAG: hypothetical protein BGO89_07810 ['Candidatus Kapabacteria' thiocyanatum]
MRTTLRIAMPVLAMCFLSLSAFAQCDSLRQFYPPGTRVHPRTPTGSDTSVSIDPRIYVTQWHFETQSDSTITRFVFDDFVGNGQRVWLNNWCKGKTWNWSDSLQDYIPEVTNAQLSSISHTTYMPLIGGDTIGFYRHAYWLWRGPQNGSIARYQSLDVVSYSVELVKQTTGQRMALLDTFRISQSGASAPCVYTWYPLASKVRYVVPASVTDTTYASIRINVYTDGGTNDTFSRSDNFGPTNSRYFINNSYFNNFMSTVNAENACAASSGGCGMAVTNGTSGTVDAAVSSGSIVQVKAFSQSGFMVTSANVTSWPSTKVLTTGSGLFIICGIDGSGSVVCTSTMLVP